MEELGTRPNLSRQCEGCGVGWGVLAQSGSQVPACTLTWGRKWRNRLFPCSSPVLEHLCLYCIDPSTCKGAQDFEGLASAYFQESPMKALPGITVAAHISHHTLLPQALAAALGFRVVVVHINELTFQMGVYTQAQRGEGMHQVHPSWWLDWDLSIS